jgi:hypothetical protein
VKIRKHIEILKSDYAEKKIRLGPVRAILGTNILGSVFLNVPRVRVLNYNSPRIFPSLNISKMNIKTFNQTFSSKLYSSRSTGRVLLLSAQFSQDSSLYVFTRIATCIYASLFRSIPSLTDVFANIPLHPILKI